jgi:hypothetical protein
LPLQPITLLAPVVVGIRLQYIKNSDIFWDVTL